MSGKVREKPSLVVVNVVSLQKSKYTEAIFSLQLQQCGRLFATKLKLTSYVHIIKWHFFGGRKNRGSCSHAHVVQWVFFSVKWYQYHLSKSDPEPQGAYLSGFSSIGSVLPYCQSLFPKIFINLRCKFQVCRQRWPIKMVSFQGENRQTKKRKYSPQQQGSH